MEVTPEQYAEFYRAQNRQRYLDRRSAENGDISVDMLTTDEFNGTDILIDTAEPVDDQVIHKIMSDKLMSCLALLEKKEQQLIYDLFYASLTERGAAEKYAVSQVAIHKRKQRILQKLKKNDGLLGYQASHFSPWKVRGIFYLPPLFLENRIIRLQILSACCSRKEQAVCLF